MIIDCPKTFDPRTSTESAQVLLLDNILDILISPDSQKRLRFDEDQFKFFNDSGESFYFKNACPILLPQRCLQYVQNNKLNVPLDRALDAFDQYLLISSIKQNQEDVNLTSDDEWYQKHLFRSREMLSGFEGTVLDIGCCSPKLSSALFSSKVKYLGIDPTFSSLDEFHLISLAEFLPIKDSCLDAVVFLTSLDHIFDFHRALDEGYRVLKPGGKIFVASLMWNNSAELYHDTVHFHHFREDELMLALKKFKIEKIQRYNWKNHAHRYGAYIVGEK